MGKLQQELSQGASAEDEAVSVQTLLWTGEEGALPGQESPTISRLQYRQALSA